MGGSVVPDRPTPPDERETAASGRPVAPPETAADPADELERERRRALKLEQDARRPLDAWERYRALVDTLEESNKLSDLGDHKARFALVIMGALNVVLFVVGTRADVVAGVPEPWRPWLTAYLVVYALVALYFFSQAIEALRPRRLRLRVPLGQAAPDQHEPLGLRFHEDALTRDVDGYREAWARVRMDQLQAELAAQAHSLAHVNRSQYLALRRLYLGLHVMIFMLTGLLVLDGLLVLARNSRGASSAAAAGVPASPDVLGAPQRLDSGGVSEASGVAWDGRAGRVLLVGDDGRLAELDRDGRPLTLRHVGGNLEDLAAHPPSGSLVLLSEKRGELVVLGPQADVEPLRFGLDSAALLGQAPGDRNHGFEGLAFHPRPGEPSEGSFYLTHQRDPAMLVELAFDPRGPARRLGAASLRGRWSLAPHRDLTAVAWLPELQRLVVLSDAEDRLLVLDSDQRVAAEVPLAGRRQEGLAFDDEGRLWVADDQLGLLRFPGARQALERLLRTQPAAQAGP